MNKYGAKKVVVDNITFDSKREAERYGELRLLEKGGEITDLEIHPKWDLHGYSLFHPYRVKIATYTADSSYREKGSHVVEDVKGYRTDMYKLKKKWMNAEYGIDIQEVT